MFAKIRARRGAIGLIFLIFSPAPRHAGKGSGHLIKFIVPLLIFANIHIFFAPNLFGAEEAARKKNFLFYTAAWAGWLRPKPHHTPPPPAVRPNN